MSGPVLVGVDGSATAMAAVETGAREAARRGVDLRLVHVCAWPAATVAPGVPPWDPGGARTYASGDRVLAEAARRARRVAPGVRVTGAVLLGDPAAVLETESRDASLTVVGSRSVTWSGRGRRGSVAARLAVRGASPVLMVRGAPDADGPVVLACDDGHVGRRAAEFAFTQASARGTEVVVLDGRPREGVRDPLAAMREHYPDVAVHRARTRARGGTGRAVAGAGGPAQLIVVGTRPRTAWTAALPTWAGRAVLRRADCPVAVVREER
ncbi:universal stress protein [Streptomyces asoensis]|uniref:universal stress protein n=1 Tax=Streptomyces asoensis TaxID=249586 RepID=UPI00340394F0